MHFCYLDCEEPIAQKGDQWISDRLFRHTMKKSSLGAFINLIKGGSMDK